MAFTYNYLLIFNAIFNLPICRRVVSPLCKTLFLRFRKILCKAHFSPCPGSQARSRARRSIRQRTQLRKLLPFSNFLIELDNEKFKRWMRKKSNYWWAFILLFSMSNCIFKKNATNATFLIKRQISMELFKIKLLKHNKL